MKKIDDWIHKIEDISEKQRLLKCRMKVAILVHNWEEISEVHKMINMGEEVISSTAQLINELAQLN